MQELRLYSGTTAGRCIAIFARDQDSAVHVTVLEESLRSVIEDLGGNDFEQQSKRDGKLIRISKSSPLFLLALATYAVQELNLRVAFYHGLCQSVDSDLIMLPLPQPGVKK